MDNLQLIENAAQSLITKSASKPPAAEVLSALLEAEKAAKKDKITYQLQQLIGDWRLCFITGTKKTQNRAGVVMGAGRYLPNFVTVKLSYLPSENGEENSEAEAGRVENSVGVGLVSFALSGPVKFLPKKNILAFDFTRATVKIFGKTIYDNYVRGGKKSEESFYQKKVGQQAFFAYFLITEKAIAARGRGGGLAIWGR
ncbi:MAG: hypothetical protein SXA11_15200 [Cyanobacteriota bacterium]|nr:hypothetical protein [Cyanobacteriota bacterium]